MPERHRFYKILLAIANHLCQSWQSCPSLMNTCVNVKGVPHPLTRSSCQPTMHVKVKCSIIKCCQFQHVIGGKTPQCENLPVDTSKANLGSQKAVPINAWLFAQGSYTCQKALLIQTSTSQREREITML